MAHGFPGWLAFSCIFGIWFSRYWHEMVIFTWVGSSQWVFQCLGLGSPHLYISHGVGVSERPFGRGTDPTTLRLTYLTSNCNLPPRGLVCFLFDILLMVQNSGEQTTWHFFKNPIKNGIVIILLMVQKSSTRWYVTYPIIYKVLYIPGG